MTNPINLNLSEFSTELNARIAKYDLLCHPYYQAWSQGTLSRDQIKGYAQDYYHHVAAFPDYLETFQQRLADKETKELVLEHKADEEGAQAKDKRSHAEVWLDFVEGMGGDRSAAKSHTPLPEIQSLIKEFEKVAATGSKAEALAAFYAYESQVPRVAKEKARGLKEFYNADARTSYYFTIHQTFDVLHSESWLKALTDEIGNDAQKREAALASAENAAKTLWQALDGVERARQLSVRGN